MEKTIVKTDNYLLVVDDSEIKKGDLILTPYGKVVKALDVHTTKFTRVGTALNDCQKIIAHLPLNDSPVLEGVMLLPPLEIEEDDIYTDAQEYAVNSGSPNRESRRKGFVDGFNKAREKYSLSNILDLYIKETARGMDMWSKEENEIMTTIGKIIESLPQPKTPTHFKFEMERSPNYRDGMLDVDVPYSYYVIKTTTNSQGQEVACGKYVYAS